MAGCKDGDEVDVSGTRLKWKYPPVEFEESKWNWPSGFAKWHSREDGIKKLKAIETADPTVGLSSEEIQRRVLELYPKVLSCLTGFK